MKRITNSFLSTFTLVSRIPLRVSLSPDYGHTVFFLPVVGVIVSALVFSTVVLGLYLLKDAFLTATAALVIQYAAFNLFHFDGLIDSADALWVFGDREKRLGILKDVNVGSFALFTGIVYLVLKIYLLFRGLTLIQESTDSISAGLGLLWVLASFGVSGRAAGAFLPVLLRPARPGGLGALLSESRFVTALAGSATAIGVVMIPWLLTVEAANELLLFIPFVAAIPVSAFLCGNTYRRKIGGYTGDAIGLTVEVGEVLHLFLFVVVAGYLP